MLALKNLDIDLTQSEKRTLFGFLSLYSFFTVVILVFISFLYFTFQKDLFLQKQRIILQEYSNDLIWRLKDLHINFDKYKYYPRDEKFKSAIYDSDKKLIFSTLNNKNVKLDNIIYTTNSSIHFIKEPESYYLGAKFIILEVNDDLKWFNKLQKEIFIFITFAFIFMVIIGFFLLKLFLKPMKDSILLLDRFIKDTTHELNTPISTILNNIEMINIPSLDEKMQRKIKRIDIAAKTISNIYEDLTFLTLNNKIISQNQNINLSNVLKLRIEYFQTLANIKKIKFKINIKDEIYLFIDNKKISKLIDNLLSNAIKYNKIDGSIYIELDNNYFFIEDSGKGLSSKQIESLFDRYTRFDKVVGGFGIGLNIVSMIAKEYNLNIEVKSTLKLGTRIAISW